MLEAGGSRLFSSMGINAMPKAEGKKKKDIRETAAGRIARGEVTGKELTDYLVKKGFTRAEAESVTSEFRELGYIDEARYAGLFIAHARQKGWGNTRIRGELARKGVAPDIARDALEDAMEEGTISSERERALEVAEKMLMGVEADDRIKARIARRLAGYGYSASVIYETIDKL